jgi:uncharacterized protein YjbI with pentapeptide repeats
LYIALEGDFDHGVFLRTNLERARFDQSSVRHADFSHARLQGCSFRGADLSNAKFIEADLRDVVFDGANLGSAVFSKVKWLGASFRGSFINDADFTDADQGAIDLSEAAKEGTFDRDSIGTARYRDIGEGHQVRRLHVRSARRGVKVRER